MQAGHHGTRVRGLHAEHGDIRSEVTLGSLGIKPEYPITLIFCLLKNRPLLRHVRSHAHVTELLS